MRTLFFAALIAATAFAQQSAAPKQTASKEPSPPVKAKTLTRAELDKLLAKPGQVLLIDVRRPDEIQTNGGFPVYLSIQAAELEQHLAEIPKGQLIVTVSNHAARAGRAADLLDSKGFKVAGAVGAQTYESEGGTLVKIQAPKQDAPKEAAEKR